MTIFRNNLDAWFSAPDGADAGELALSQQSLSLAITIHGDTQIPLDDREHALRRLRENYLYICASRRGHDVRLQYSSPPVGQS